jgi:hypothetical protein
MGLPRSQQLNLVNNLRPSPVPRLQQLNLVNKLRPSPNLRLNLVNKLRPSPNLRLNLVNKLRPSPVPRFRLRMGAPLWHLSQMIAPQEVKSRCRRSRRETFR